MGQSRITNGALLVGTDGRGPWQRRAREVMAAHLSDLGGVDNISEAERSIVRRAATLTVELEQLEAKFAAGEATREHLETYQRVTNTLRRTLETIGIKRRARDDSGPTLREFIEGGTWTDEPSD